MKSLIVYNICGISKNENVGWYISCIKNLLNQKGNFDLVVSSCLNSTQVRSIIQRETKNKVYINCIDEQLPVNITFNSTVKSMVNLNGEYDFYLYVDSGMNVGNDTLILQEVEKRFENNENGIVTLQSSNDNGFSGWLNKDGFITDNDFQIPIGKACNMHMFAFSKDYYKSYNSIIPDIFAAYCTESVFSFFCAGINKKWTVIKDKIIYHLKGDKLDTASAGFDKVGQYGQSWNNLLCGIDIRSLIFKEEAWNSGFGYEECQQIFMHNRNAYDENYNCKEPERLRNFLNLNMFLNEKINYNNILNLLIIKD